MNNKEWESLFNIFYPKKLEYQDNKHLFTKIAFDLFSLNSSPVKSLWILEDGEDGKQYLSATYETEDQSLEATGSWSTMANKEASMVVLYYKGYPIHKFNKEQFGFDNSNVHLFQNMINKKANSDNNFIKEVINSQNKEKQEIILQQFPELAN